MRTLEMPIIDCKINVFITCLANWVISEGNRATTDKITQWAITDTKLYVPFVALSTPYQNYCNNWNQDSNAQLNME